MPTLLNGGEALVAALSAHDVNTVFGIPGTHNLGIFAAMPKYGVTNVTTRHEQGAGYAADGFARSSGKIGVAITTTGPAALNAATALGQAYSDSVPVLLIAPGMPTGHPSHGNGLLHELRSQSSAMAGVVAESHRVESVAEIPVAVAQAFARMRRRRPRPEYLEIPLDLLDQTAEVTIVPPLEPGTAEHPRPADVRNAAEALAGAKKILLVVGGGASGASSEVTHLAEILNAPVISTTNGKGTVREDHPLALGGGAQLEEVVTFAEQADAIVAIGTELSTPDWWGRYPSFPKTMIRIDIDPDGMLINAIPSNPLVGDARAVVADVIAHLEALGVNRVDALEPSYTDFKASIVAAQRNSADTWLRSLDALNEVLPDTAVIAADNAMACYNGALTVIRSKHPRSFLFPTGAGTLGYGLPAGIGAKLARPGDAVVVIQGDGGLMFSATELAAAAEYGMALPVIVYDNGGYGEIRNEMADRDEPIHSVALGSPDFPKLARSLGCYGFTLDDPSKLGEAVQEALAANRPTVIHVVETSRAAAGLRLWSS